MNKKEIRNIVVETSKNFYLNNQFVAENTIEDSLREDAEELEACKKLVYEALRIPTFHMNCLYGLNKCIKTSLDTIEECLGTNKQDTIEETVCKLADNYPKAKALNEERYDIYDPENISKSFRTIRELEEGYNYRSKNTMSNYIIDILESYMNKLNDTLDKYDSMTESLNDTYKALKENGISDIVSHKIDHFIMEAKYNLKNNMKNDIDYIIGILEVGLTRTKGQTDLPEDIDIEKESIDSIFED